MIIPSADAIAELSDADVVRLHELVFYREYNEAHPDDYFNAGGFLAHWASYTDDERADLMSESKR